MHIIQSRSLTAALILALIALLAAAAPLPAPNSASASAVASSLTLPECVASGCIPQWQDLPGTYCSTYTVTAGPLYRVGACKCLDENCVVDDPACKSGWTLTFNAPPGTSIWRWNHLTQDWVCYGASISWSFACLAFGGDCTCASIEQWIGAWNGSCEQPGDESCMIVLRAVCTGCSFSCND